MKLMWQVILVLALSTFLPINVFPQYWGDQMMDIYSEQLLNGQISVLNSSKIVSVDNDLLLFSDGYGFHIFNISNPSSPYLVGRMGVPGLSGRFVFSQSHAFVTTWDGLAIINYTNPTTPQIISYIKINEQSQDVDLNTATNTLFISTSVGLKAFDVTDKTNPVLISSIQIDNEAGYHNVALNQTNNILYYTTGRTLYVVDVSNSSAMQIVTSSEFNPTTQDGTCHDGPKINGNYLYVPVTTALHIYDISSPTNPVLIYEANPTAPNTLYSAAVSGNLFITGHWSDYGWNTIDVTNPATPQMIQFYPDPEYAYGHGIGKIVNNLFFLINFTRGSDLGWRIRIIDVSNPAAASQLSYIDSPVGGRATVHKILNRDNKIYSLVAQDNKAYTGASTYSYSSYLTILDVTDPVNPIQESMIDVPKVCISIAANENYAVVRGYSLGYMSYDHFLYLVSIADPQNPVIVDQYSDFPTQLSNDYVNSMYLFENKLYVTMNPYLMIFDISGNSFQLLNYVSTMGEAARGIKVRKVGNDVIAYVAGGIKGIQIYNVTDPQNIFLTGFHQPAGIAWDVWLEDNLAFLAIGGGGVRVYDVTNNLAVPIKSISTSAQAKNIIVENNLAFVEVFASGSDSKMQVFDISDLNTPVNLGVYQSSGLTNQISISHNGRRLYMSDLYSHTIYRPLFNFNPLPFSLISPPDSTTATGDIEFVWQKAEDANDDTLTYELTFWSSSWDTTVTVVQDTSVTLNQLLFPNPDLYYWTAQVTDGQFVQSALDTFSINLIITGTANEQNLTPQEFALYQNYPNPFNPETNIKFDLTVTSNVRVTIYNTLGQIVAELANNTYTAGQHQIKWNGEFSSGVKAPSGIYFIKLSAKLESGEDVFSKTIKAILMK